MHVINASNVCEAYVQGMELLKREGVQESSRAGNVLVIPAPVVTVYQFPQERVLLEPTRDANPWFHLMEALWMLAGRNDATWLDQFVSDYSKRFAEDGGQQWGAYGHRWRTHFVGTRASEDTFEPRDQLTEVVELLKANPNDRRAVIQMWDTEYDLGANTKDVPCNLVIMPRIVDGSKLDITVACRSNDAIWGAYGSNAVHFSILQEYLARRIGVDVGIYYQLSNNFHAYVDVFGKKYKPDFKCVDPYGCMLPREQQQLNITPIVTVPEVFDEDLVQFMKSPDEAYFYKNTFFHKIAIPMLFSYQCWRNKDIDGALGILQAMPDRNGDWYCACQQWYHRRISKQVAAE